MGVASILKMKKQLTTRKKSKLKNFAFVHKENKEKKMRKQLHSPFLSVLATPPYILSINGHDGAERKQLTH